VITGRVHPGETNASWIVHGMIKFLIGKDKVAIELRKRVIFKIIPMINSDGVTAGNSRCSFIGRDINRLFGHPNSKLTPEPFNLRALIKELQKIDKHKV
jgi:murein tripeptide amidase MpaA